MALSQEPVTSPVNEALMGDHEAPTLLAFCLCEGEEECDRRASLSLRLNVGQALNLKTVQDSLRSYFHVLPLLAGRASH